MNFYLSHPTIKIYDNFELLNILARYETRSAAKAYATNNYKENKKPIIRITRKGRMRDVSLLSEIGALGDHLIHKRPKSSQGRSHNQKLIAKG